jgi:HEAT repeat protein
MGAAARPGLMDALKNERDSDLRQIVLRTLWQSRSDDVVPLLAEALADQDPTIWKEVLDGLVNIGGPKALEALRTARRLCGAQKAEWIDEAIERISERRP